MAANLNQITPALDARLSDGNKPDFCTGIWEFPSESLQFKGDDPTGWVDVQKEGQVESLAPVPFGTGKHDIMDLSINLMLRFDPGRSGLSDFVRGVLERDEDSAQIRTELCKLNVYGKTSFQAKKDILHNEDIVGSLVVFFPTPHEGGTLILRYGGKEHTFDSSLELSHVENSIAYIAFYSDVEHEVPAVESGNCTSLTYNLYFSDATQRQDILSVGDLGAFHVIVIAFYAAVVALLAIGDSVHAALLAIGNGFHAAVIALHAPVPHIRISVTNFINQYLLDLIETLPSAKLFRHEKGIVNLREAKNFTLLLAKIRNHLIASMSTRSIYVFIANKFFSGLSQDEQAICKKPTDNDFREFVLENWPVFSSSNCQKPADRLVWGWTSEELNEIKILSSIVVSLESAAANPCAFELPVELYQLIITVVILHELSHAFMRFWFDQIDIPSSVGIFGDLTDEGLVEKVLMGGRFAVEWDDPQDFGDSDAIDRVVLINDLGSWNINAASSRAILFSLHEMSLGSLVPANRHFSSSSSVRARLTEPIMNPAPIKPPIELDGANRQGPVRSFIARDTRSSCGGIN